MKERHCKDCLHFVPQEFGRAWSWCRSSKTCVSETRSCDHFKEKTPFPSTAELVRKCKDCKNCDIHMIQKQTFPNSDATPHDLALCEITDTLVDIECHADPCGEFDPRMPKMKACPFCGSSNLKMSLDMGDSIVTCFICKSRGPKSHDEKIAIKIWNERY